MSMDVDNDANAVEAEEAAIDADAGATAANCPELKDANDVKVCCDDDDDDDELSRK